MLDGQPILNLAVYFSGIALCFLGLLMISIVGKTVEKQTRRYFTIFFLCLAVDLSLNTAAELLSGNAQMRGALNVICFLHQFFSPLLAYIVSIYLLSILEREHPQKTYRMVLGFMFAAFVLSLVLCQINSGYFYIDENGVFQRGSLYVMSVAVSCLPLLLNIYLLIKNAKTLSKGERYAFWVYSALPALAVIVQVFIKGAHFVIPATVIAALAMFIFIIADRTQQYYEQQRRNTELGIAVMLSQIKPHFLYNTLGVIQNLCHKDPAMAEKAVAKFSRYLRQNIDSLSGAELIPFKDELSHTKNYLELEKLRFEDMLEVSYEISCDTFRLPPIILRIRATAFRKNERRHFIQFVCCRIV